PPPPTPSRRPQRPPGPRSPPPAEPREAIRVLERPPEPHPLLREQRERLGRVEPVLRRARRRVLHLERVGVRMDDKPHTVIGSPQETLNGRCPTAPARTSESCRPAGARSARG